MIAQHNEIPPHLLVVVPGWAGSKLGTPDKIVWGNFSHMFMNPLQWKTQLDSLYQTMTCSSSQSELKPMGIMDEVVFVSPWGKLQKYSRLLEALSNMGYSIDPVNVDKEVKAAYTFAYDWRQDNRKSACELKTAIEHWRNNHPGERVWIVAHSNGGLVARWYIEKCGGKNHVDKLFLMGSPWDGTPKALWLLIDGLAVLIRKSFNIFNVQQRTRDMVRTFPSLYQLLPLTDPFLHTVDNVLVNVFNGEGWLDSELHHLLEDGKRFHEELGTVQSVETLCFYGEQYPTPSAAFVYLLEKTHWGKIQWIETEVGDGTIPRRSALHPTAHKKFACVARHDNIYVAPDVLATLKHELIDQYLPAERAILVTTRLVVTFVPNKDVYEPGEPVKLQATIFTRSEESVPVSEARIAVSFVWEQDLPGSTPSGQLPTFLPVDIWENEAVPGQYEGSLDAPMIEGYYRLKAVVYVTSDPPLQLEELIAVEKV